MKLFKEFSMLDVNDIGSWPNRIKLLISALIFLVIIAGGYEFVIKALRQNLVEEQEKEIALKREFLDKKGLSINLSVYQAQLLESQQMLDALLLQLPNESEMPNLLIDLTKVGLERGLQFEKIKPDESVAKGFYIESSVDITVSGSYDQIAGFVSDVAALSRIVNITDFAITRKQGQLLTFMATANTYHYLEGFDEAAD